MKDIQARIVGNQHDVMTHEPTVCVKKEAAQDVSLGVGQSRGGDDAI